MLKYFCICLLTFVLFACERPSKPEVSTTHPTVTSAAGKPSPTSLEWVNSGDFFNQEAPIPPQCYTDTEGKYNPCYVCHQSYAFNSRPNQMNDGSLQGDYGFSDLGVHNHWKNLFHDRTASIAKLSDAAITDYVNQDNYTPLLTWMDSGAWAGVNPQLKQLHLGADAFDANGLAKDGSFWVAFNYKPLPSTFWPTNGSTDDVMIRLPAAFRESQGQFNRSIYFANLALLELAITNTDTTSSISLDEHQLNVDINQDGQYTSQVTQVRKRTHYLGDASQIPLTPLLYPKETEFLHTVRYVGATPEGKIYNAPRMKEVRYMVKKAFLTPRELEAAYYREEKEKDAGNLPTYYPFDNREATNAHGWHLWGFIENQQGALRPQHPEEQFFCTGCHNSIGATIDDTFAFPRKVAGAAGWGYIDLTKMLDTPSRGETQGEYLTYLERVGGGDEFRQNEEMKQRWFNTDGSVKKDKVQALPSIYDLITPSKERALALNKAYKLIVEEQSFIFGRDTVLKPATNVLKTVDDNKAPLEPEYRHTWDIRPAI